MRSYGETTCAATDARTLVLRLHGDRPSLLRHVVVWAVRVRSAMCLCLLLLDGMHLLQADVDDASLRDIRRLLCAYNVCD